MAFSFESQSIKCGIRNSLSDHLLNEKLAFPRREKLNYLQTSKLIKAQIIKMPSFLLQPLVACLLRELVVFSIAFRGIFKKCPRASNYYSRTVL